MTVSKTKQRKRQARKRRQQSASSYAAERKAYNEKLYTRSEYGPMHADWQMRNDAQAERRDIPVGNPARGRRAYTPPDGEEGEDDDATRVMGDE